MAWLIPLALLAAAICLLIARAKRNGPRFLAHAEYWVYVPEAKMPPQDAIMTRMFRDNPRRGTLGPREGLLFSDIRLHMALAKRDKNPTQFRPDLFQDVTELSAEHLDALAKAQAMVKLRYVSEIPLPDARHLGFLLHASDAVAALSGAQLIFDSTGGRMLLAKDLALILDDAKDASAFELHVDTQWNTGQLGGWAGTAGMIKLGLPDLVTPEAPIDHQTLVLRLLERTAQTLWEANEFREELDLVEFDDLYKVRLKRMSQGAAEVNIERFNAV